MNVSHTNAPFCSVKLPDKEPAIPEPVDIPPLTDLPSIEYGTQNKLIAGVLPNMSGKMLPGTNELQTWTEQSQLEFWRQRNSHYSRCKLKELQRLADAGLSYLSDDLEQALLSRNEKLINT